MEALSRVLMGLSHPIQIIGQAREFDGGYDWPQPPRLERRWYAVISGSDETALAWRVRTLKGALDGVGLRTGEVVSVDAGSGMVGRPLPGCVREGEGWASTMVLRRWPREVAPGWLGQALAEDIPVDVAIHVQPQDPQRIARFLKRQQAWQDDGGKDAANELGRRDAEATRQKLIARTDRPVRVAVALTVRGSTQEQLRQRVETLGHAVGLALGDVRLAKYEQDRGLLATLPTGECDLLGVWRTLDCTSVASTWPFQPVTVNHANGADIGTTHEGSLLVRLDPFDMSLESFGWVVVAKVGAGKSYFIKLLVRRLRGVEVWIVEQRIPAEYRGIEARTLNLADYPQPERASRLRDYVSQLWDTAKRDPRPRILILDELWSLLRDPTLAALVEEIARIGRHHFLSLVIATQQVQELIDSGKAVLDNAAVRVMLKQHDRDLESLCNAVGLSVPARRFLRGAARGQALIDVGGMLIPVDVQASPAEHAEITTDPREVHRNGRADDDSVSSRNGRFDAVPGGPQGREGDLCDSDRLVPVAAAL